MLENSKTTASPQWLIFCVCVLMILALPIFSTSLFLSTIMSNYIVLLVFHFVVHRKIFTVGQIFGLTFINDILIGICLGATSFSLLLSWKILTWFENKLFVQDNGSMSFNVMRYGIFALLAQILALLVFGLVKLHLPYIRLPELSTIFLAYFGSIVLYSILFIPLEWLYVKLYQH